MKILVLEDEQRAGKKLIDLIESLDTEKEIHWERSISGALKHLQHSPSPDLIFSDIELLDGNVFDIYNQKEITCPIIFCTAYDRFFLNAFKTNGIAYLLKPYTKEQFLEAWQKYQLLFQTSDSGGLTAQLVTDLRLLIHNKSSNYKKTFSVKKPDGIFLLKTENIVFFQAQGDFVIAYDQKQKKHTLNLSLTNIEQNLDPDQFFRINRSEIIQMKYLHKYASYFRNKLAIHLYDTKEVLYTSGSRTPDFRKWIGED